MPCFIVKWLVWVILDLTWTFVWLSFKYRVEDGCTNEIFKKFWGKGEISFFKPWQTWIIIVRNKKYKKLQTLTLFCLRVYTILLLNFKQKLLLWYTLFYKPKTPLKWKLLKEMSNKFQLFFNVMFFFLICYIIVGVFGLYNQGIIK